MHQDDLYNCYTSGLYQSNNGFVFFMSFYLNSGEIQLSFQSVLICFGLVFISVN